MYFDINGMYVRAMCQLLPFDCIKWLENVDAFNFNVPDDNPIVSILEVDLEYPTHLYDKHSDLPLAPTKAKPPNSKEEKMLTTLEDKKNTLFNTRI